MDDRRDERIEDRRRARRREATRTWVILICLTLLAVGAVGFGLKLLFGNKDKKESQTEDAVFTERMTETESETQTETETETETEPPATLNLKREDIYSANAILIRKKTGQVVFDKDSTQKIYPASMTKVMTAVIALESISDLQTRVRLSEGMFEQLYLEGASMAGFLPGEEVSALNLLYGIMLPSGAECCTGLADYIAGSEDAFAKKMNQKAAELGMEGTHFVNASGLHHPEHYSTVADLAKLLEYALEKEVFREIASTAAYTTEANESHPEGLTLYSTLFGNMSEEIRSGNLIQGGKTGYTPEAGLCLASFGQVNGEEYILVTAGAAGSHETEPFHIMDAYQIYGHIK